MWQVELEEEATGGWMPFRGVSQPLERRGEELGDLHSRKDGWAEARVRQELIEQCFSSTNTAYHCTGKSPGEGGLLRPPEKARAPQSVSPSGRLSPQPVAVGGREASSPHRKAALLRQPECTDGQGPVIGQLSDWSRTCKRIPEKPWQWPLENRAGRLEGKNGNFYIPFTVEICFNHEWMLTL